MLVQQRLPAQQVRTQSAIVRPSLRPQLPRSSFRMPASVAPARAPRAPSSSCRAMWYADIQPGDDLPADYDTHFPDNNKNRRAGVILHPTSLPSPYGIGDLGKEAFEFIDWLASAGMQAWQVLPLVPPDPEYYSPYSGLDTNCGNPLLISIDTLIQDGLLDASDAPAKVPVADVDFIAVAAVKFPLLKKAAQRLLHDGRFVEFQEGMAAYRKQNLWVEESALFDNIRQQTELTGLTWWDWPEDLRLRKPEALAAARKQHAEAIEEFVAIQYLFDRQWLAAKKYANSKGVLLIGDMPIYVGGHSADVWANQHLFELMEDGKPEQVSGVPPDAFSETGQLWGSPLYRWPAHAQEGYEWWSARLGRALQLYDETRIDHFRAFAGYWAVDGKAETAMEGTWRKGPGKELFDALEKKIGKLPILAEDLGVITSDVCELREAIGAPGMVVLQFAWGGGPNNVHLPHMHYENCFCYPGTHDNETSVGWFQGSANEEDKAYIKAYLGSEGKDIAWDFIRSGLESVARTTVIMMQDIMRLDNSARMNTPGKAAGNWAWRVGEADLWQKLAPEAKELRKLAYTYNRLPKGVKVQLVDKPKADKAKAADMPKAEAADTPKEDKPKEDKPKA